MISKSEVFSSWQRGQFSMQLGGQISMQIDRKEPFSDWTCLLSITK
ncbi:hypothetical protein GAMM_10083 [Gammaproteobacteria bacterium]